MTQNNGKDYMKKKTRLTHKILLQYLGTRRITQKKQHKVKNSELLKTSATTGTVDSERISNTNIF